MHFSSQPSPSDQQLPAIGSVQWTSKAQHSIAPCPSQPQRVARSPGQTACMERAGASVCEVARTERGAAEAEQQTGEESSDWRKTKATRRL
ncbi:hypothetical protein AGOR_G00062490 [Albula goreensis]|uniref:Uncharacterized protein n=1 Tax=Albula goreensis TaxID=1534307 RepID=A0A8T3DYY1_9TELE|nr:hypothetical protein AGOR_G00062490 [Albula goreensis]